MDTRRVDHTLIWSVCVKREVGRDTRETTKTERRQGEDREREEVVTYKIVMVSGKFNIVNTETKRQQHRQETDRQTDRQIDRQKKRQRQSDQMIISWTSHVLFCHVMSCNVLYAIVCYQKLCYVVVCNRTI